MSDSPNGAEAAPGRQTKRGPGVDLERMNVAELVALRDAADAMIGRKQDEAKTALLDKWRAEAAENNLSIESLLPFLGPPTPAGRERKAKVGQGSKVAAKFRNPETGETWSGRGRQPKWLENRNREDFRV